MVLKIIDATQAKPGATIMVEGEAYTVKTNDISKTGKHGSAKCRIMAQAIFSDKKKILAVPGHERFDVPNVEKKRGQVLSVTDNSASVMDLETFENFDVTIYPDCMETIAEEKQVEVWDIEGKRMVMRVL